MSHVCVIVYVCVSVCVHVWRVCVCVCTWLVCVCVCVAVAVCGGVVGAIGCGAGAVAMEIARLLTLDEPHDHQFTVTTTLLLLHRLSCRLIFSSLYARDNESYLYCGVMCV